MERYFVRKYGLSRAEVEQRRTDQDELCAICHLRAAKHLDHDHATGQVREMLCFNCNGALGQFQDRIELLDSAIDYLHSHRPAVSDPAVLQRLALMTYPSGVTPDQEAARAELLAGSGSS